LATKSSRIRTYRIGPNNSFRIRTYVKSGGGGKLMLTSGPTRALPAPFLLSKSPSWRLLFVSKRYGYLSETFCGARSYLSPDAFRRHPMTSRFRILAASLSLVAAALLILPLVSSAQTTPATDRWLHVRVIASDGRGETVRVNVPLDRAEKILPAINKDRLHDGKVRFHEAECDGVDLKAIMNAVRTSKDGEFVTVQADDADVRVAKQS